MRIGGTGIGSPASLPKLAVYSRRGRAAIGPIRTHKLPPPPPRRQLTSLLRGGRIDIRA